MDNASDLPLWTWFSITQTSLGSPLEFLPPLGSVELDALIDCYVVGDGHIQQKRAQASLEFLNAIEETEFAYGPVIRFYHVMHQFDWEFPLPGKSHAQSFSTTSDDGCLSTSSRLHKTRAVGHRAETSIKGAGQRRLPGFSIMTKEGIDITDCVSRGPKTKEQRDHAALMRRIRACQSCKRRKQRCDPSHHEKSTSPDSTSSHDTSTRSHVSRHKTVTGTPSVSFASVSPYSSLDAPEQGLPTRSGNLAFGFSHDSSPATGSNASNSFQDGSQRCCHTMVETQWPLHQRRQALPEAGETSGLELAILDYLNGSFYDDIVNDESSLSTRSCRDAPYPGLGQSDMLSTEIDNATLLDNTGHITVCPAVRRYHSSQMRRVEGFELRSQQSHSDLSKQTEGHNPFTSERQTTDPRQIMHYDNVGSVASPRVDCVVAATSIPVAMTCTGDSPFDHNYRIAGVGRRLTQALHDWSQCCLNATWNVNKFWTTALSSMEANRDTLSRTTAVAKAQMSTASKRRIQNSFGKIKLHLVKDRESHAPQSWQSDYRTPSVAAKADKQTTCQHTIRSTGSSMIHRPNVMDGALLFLRLTLDAYKGAWGRSPWFSQNGLLAPLHLC